MKSGDTASSVGSVGVRVGNVTSTLVVVLVAGRRRPCGTLRAAAARRTPISSRRHLIPRARTATLRRVDRPLGGARPRSGLAAVALPRAVTRQLRVGERHAAVGSHARLEVESLLEQARSLLQLCNNNNNNDNDNITSLNSILTVTTCILIEKVVVKIILRCTSIPLNPAF